MMMQGTIILSTVASYEIVKRIKRKQQQQLVGQVEKASKAEVIKENA